MGPLKNLPPELVFGWVLWLAGGLVLMRWFRRRSEAPPHSPSTVRHIAPKVVARRGQTAAPDAFSELHALLDPPDDPPR